MIEPNFYEALADLALRVNCATSDSDLWQLIFTHKSFAHENTIDAEATGNLLEVIRHIGREALRSVFYEYCLDQAAMDPVETSRAWQGASVILSSLIQDFQLIPTCRVGKGLRDIEQNNRGFQEALAFRFLAGIILSSSYDNLRNLLRPKVESLTLLVPNNFQLSGARPKKLVAGVCPTLLPGQTATLSLGKREWTRSPKGI